MKSKVESGTRGERTGTPLLSPLRYPGSKRKLVGFVREVLLMNALRPFLFVELFAGGASVSLQLLQDDAVEKIGLVDLDPLVASFWSAVFYDTDWLVEQIRTIDITLERWKEYKLGGHSTKREQALACIFLNRTSFSGILAPSAGPLGGWEQSSSYTIDCRFPRETLIKRVKQAAAFRDRVAFVWNVSWDVALSRLPISEQHWSQVFIYLDPPFFEKADRLYTHYFTDDDHARLRDVLLDLEAPWLLSYDFHPRLLDLYLTGKSKVTKCQIELLYSLSSGPARRAREAIISNLPNLPVSGADPITDLRVNRVQASVK